MRLLHVIGSMDPCFGGPCQVIRSSIQALERLGVHNEVVCIDDPNAPFLKDDDFKIFALGPRRSQWYYSAGLLPWLRNNLGRFNVIIVHGMWLYPNYAINKTVHFLQRGKTGVSEKIKVFIMPHGMLDPYFQQAPERRLKAVRNWIYWKLIEGNIINDAEGLFFTCEKELELARHPFRPYKPKREINVGYGILAPPPFIPEMQDIFTEICKGLDKSPYFLFLGRIHEKKGIDILINAYSALKQAYYMKKIIPNLVIAGPGLETLYGQKLQKMVCENSLLKNTVFFSGMLTGMAKWGAFYGCETFVLPSHQENFGIAIVEALACGKPVLISKKINIWKQIKEGGGGMAAEDNQNDVYRILDEWMGLPFDLKQLMKIKAQETYKKYFATDSSVKHMLNAINN
jgi:glycosyltransferase involved in cell wall biosynthesis